jgi:glycosyltransferase involved in cell wall biosynthesis
MPEISVVIPTHNRWPLLRRTLAGALAQEDVDHEVIVVDDGSSDGTHDRLGRIGDPRLRTVRHETPRRVAGARNSGIKIAAGEWIAFLDDDDLWAPRKLRTLLDAPGAADAAVAYSGMVAIDPALTVIGAQAAPDPAGIGEEILRRQAIPGGCANLITRTELAREVGGFDSELRVAEDWDMWIRLLLAGEGRAAASPEFLYGYYQHGVSSVLLNKDVIEADYARIEAKYARERRARGVEMDMANITRWLARNFLRAGDRRGAARLYLQGAWRYRSAGSLARAAGALLGEDAMARLAPSRHQRLPSPAWLDLYRPGGRLDSLAASFDGDGAGSA